MFTITGLIQYKTKTPLTRQYKPRPDFNYEVDWEKPCSRCKDNFAEVGFASCKPCRDYIASVRPPKTVKGRAKRVYSERAAYELKRRQDANGAGKCAMCACRPHREGKKTCQECVDKAAARRAKKLLVPRKEPANVQAPDAT